MAYGVCPACGWEATEEEMEVIEECQECGSEEMFEHSETESGVD